MEAPALCRTRYHDFTQRNSVLTTNLGGRNSLHFTEGEAEVQGINATSRKQPDQNLIQSPGRTKPSP